MAEYPPKRNSSKEMSSLISSPSVVGTTKEGIPIMLIVAGVLAGGIGFLITYRSASMIDQEIREDLR